MKTLLDNNELILMEASIVERLRRSKDIQLHPTLVHSPLIYDKAGRRELTKLYLEYIDIAIEAKLPFLMDTPTWRANRERVHESSISRSINYDAVKFLQELRDTQKEGAENIKIGGSIGCKNDCYLPEEGLTSAEAEQFHSWQIGQLVKGGADFLMAVTLPGVEESLGIAKAMEKTGIPYIISYVINRNGNVLDGTPLIDAIDRVDDKTAIPPLGYMVNCSHPTFLCADKQPAVLFKRLIGYSANASSLDHCELDGSEKLESENVSEWGESMLELNEKYGMKILGGCCGTDGEHLKYLLSRYEV
jgi:homocysteine S-methyltransferase